MASREVYPKDIVKALRKLGFFVLRQKGSHIQLSDTKGRRATIAIHPKPLSFGTLYSVLRQADITRKELDEAL